MLVRLVHPRRLLLAPLSYRLDGYLLTTHLPRLAIDLDLRATMLLLLIITAPRHATAVNGLFG